MNHLGGPIQLYVFGVDAYHLVGALKPMQNDPNLVFAGATGLLYLSHGRIYRELTWAQFQQGLPRLIP